MSEPLLLSAAAVRLLLEVLELPEPILSAAAIHLDPTLADQLITHGLLVHHDFEDVTVSRADHDDVPVSLVWSEQLGKLTYFGGAAGPIAVDKDVLRRWRVGIDCVLAAATLSLNLQVGDRPFALVGGVLWEVGDARLDGRRPRTPIWFARRLWDPSVREKVRQAAQLRPNTRQRILLTSSRSDRVRDIRLPGLLAVSLADVLARPTALAVSAEILAGRMGTAPDLELAGPIALSPDGRSLRINSGLPISFRSERQIAAIRRLVDAYQRGEGVRITELTEHGSPRRLFGTSKWKVLSPHLKSVNGLWSLQP